ncbi:mll9530 (plasmid) [Mesorhizobium japonicum MAFF 303099]|uniref:Mll9530 protein n=1 Tax=Mesorhizobium japonicum (strain LMG 29417 / CECT 9101 / MAFF 303099) TaxID=266835 RepID=Q98PB7_RHILO|nr:mll9530 [Mesorhizobium japonicum MAFF 303099]
MRVTIATATRIEIGTAANSAASKTRVSLSLNIRRASCKLHRKLTSLQPPIGSHAAENKQGIHFESGSIWNLLMDTIFDPIGTARIGANILEPGRKLEERVLRLRIVLNDGVDPGVSLN